MERRSSGASVEDDGYGGMELEIYDAIVHFKKTGEYPPFADQRLNRNAHFHWRLRCQNFVLSDNDTLLYCNPNCHVDSVSGPRIVVKKGEARAAVKIVHERIGHAGQKQTHMAVAKRLYWRSIRRDTIRFVFDCEICQKKRAIRNRAKESQALPDSVEVYMTSDPPPLDASEAIVADRLLLNESTSYLEAMLEDDKTVARISQRQVYDYVDEEDMDEFGEVFEQIDDESGDVTHNEDYMRSMFGAGMTKNEVAPDERGDEVIDPIKASSSSARKRYRLAVPMEHAETHMPPTVVNHMPPNRVFKRSTSFAGAYESPSEKLDEERSGDTDEIVDVDGVAVTQRRVHIANQASKRSPIDSRIKVTMNGDDLAGVQASSADGKWEKLCITEELVSLKLHKEYHWNETLAASAAKPRLIGFAQQLACQHFCYGSAISDNLPEVTGVRVRSGMNHYVRRRMPPYMVQRSAYDEVIADSPLGAAGTIISSDKELIRLQKQVLLLQRQVYTMKKQYLQMKIDNFPHYHQHHSVDMLRRLEEEILPPDEAPTVAGNEEVPAEGSICVER
ncbi:hypothetical protein Tcan_13508 [Toxocara canis]|uniref:Integrase zinc-binding domain-containing protein n=1 Tax=Toxocara canis TaxID=6265 RepID=A0A0B2VNM6_TOXCA|nr:hypothetical protein Tcan_13508 [Toxocara canis]